MLPLGVCVRAQSHKPRVCLIIVALCWNTCSLGVHMTAACHWTEHLHGNSFTFYYPGADVNAETRDGLTAAYFCVFCAHSSYLKELIKHGIDINRKYKDSQRTLLHYAAEAGQNKVLKVLLRRKANTEIHAGERSFTPLHLAIRTGQEMAVELLLKYGADMEARSIEGYTALHHASRCSQHDVGKLLVASGANVDATSGLIIAARQRSTIAKQIW